MITAVAADFNTELELGELQAFISDNEEELGSAGASARTMGESTKVRPLAISLAEMINP